MKKYAMIIINSKPDEYNRMHYRRVLISYKGSSKLPSRGVKNFTRTSYIDCDDYFKNPSSSHQYKFEDNGYTLLNCDYNSQMFIGKKRKYHIYCGQISPFFDNPNVPTLFTAESNEEAIKIFQERDELR